jgi:hypothetical protein
LHTDVASFAVEQTARTRKISGKIMRTKARKAQQARKTKNRKRVSSPNLSDTDYEDDEDGDDDEEWEGKRWM